MLSMLADYTKCERWIALNREMDAYDHKHLMKWFKVYNFAHVELGAVKAYSTRGALQHARENWNCFLTVESLEKLNKI